LLLREVTVESDGGERKIVKLGELAGAPKPAPGCTGCDAPKNAALAPEAAAAPAAPAGLDTTVVRKLEQDTKILPASTEPPDFRKAFAISDLAPGSGREVVLNGVAVAVFNVDGVLHAVQHECPHQGGPLAEGSLQGTVVTCSWHQWQFDVATGRGVSVSESGIKRFEVKVEGDAVYVKV
jgi:nitrite reductase/ring-hydroxylating ferredoxin subunit